MTVAWEIDGVDPTWSYAPGVGAVRGAGYRPGGWWFLAAWQPDNRRSDIGPFPTRKAAIARADVLAGDLSDQKSTP